MIDIGHFKDAVARSRYLDIYNEGMALLPRPDMTKDVTTRFGAVRAYRFGDLYSAPLMLLPGRQASTPMWRSNLPSLLRSNCVYTIDLLGEPGLSDQRLAIRNNSDQAEWLHDVINGLELDSINLLGVSFGGWTAVNYAAHYPSHVNSLILLDPAMTFANVSWKMIVVSLGAIVPGLPKPLLDKLMSWISGGAEQPRDLMEGRLIESGMRDFKLQQPRTKPFPKDALEHLTMPTLVLLAGRSIVHDPVTAAENARSTVAQSEVEIWPDASHAINGEYPDEIATRIETFLDAHK